MLGMSPTGADINVGILRNNLAHGGTLLANEAGDDDAFNSWTLPVVVSDADFTGLSPVGMDGPRQADGSLPVLASFRLAPGSDLVDKGQDLGFPFAGAAPDLGAFETGLAGQGGSTGSSGGGGGAAGRGGTGTGGGRAGSSGSGLAGMTGTGGGPSNTGGSGAVAGTGSGGAPSSGGGQGAVPSSSGGAPGDGPGGGSNGGGCHCQLDDHPLGHRTFVLLAALGLAALGRSRRRR
jgi:MYXO-CTERM domain-containing protein